MKLWILIAALILSSPVFAELSANAIISPRMVDTSVPNQTFVYTINATNETVNRVILNSSGAFVFTAISDVTLNGSSCRGSSGACEGNNVTVEPNRINLTFFIPVSSGIPINITFTATTPSTFNVSNFTAYMNNTATAQGLATPVSANSTLVTAAQQLNVSVAMTKGTAIINGSDFWEFAFTLGFNTNQNGLIQFRMNNWIDDIGQTMNIILSNGTYYATLRNNSGNFTDANGKVVVNTSYMPEVGVNKTGVVDSKLYLRMIVPLGANLSSTWSSTYNFLLRAHP